MATVRETMRHCLLTYPGIFTSPFQVVCHWFTTIGNGYDWDSAGELVSHDYSNTPVTMYYSDLIENTADAKKYDDIAAPENVFGELRDNQLLEIEAEWMQRKFIEDNIERVLNGRIITNYFGSNTKGGRGVNSNISTTYAKAFNFPDHITKDWALALSQFIDHWFYILNLEYGVSQKDLENRSFWTENARDARLQLIAARDRLYPVLYGKTYVQHAKEIDDIINGLDN